MSGHEIMNGRSEFYPPRANRLGMVRASWFRFVVFLDRLVDPEKIGMTISAGCLLLSLLLPGFSLRRFGYRQLARIFVSVYALCCVVFLVWLGYPAASYAFITLLALHTISNSLVLRHAFVESTFFLRISTTLLTFIALIALIYMPARHLLEHYAMPLRSHGSVVVINTSVDPSEVKRQDWAAYRINGFQDYFSNQGGHGAIILRSGVNLGKISALPGETVTFTETNFFVNGASFPRQPQMPKQGEWVVPENHWFIWPDFDIQIAGIAGQQAINLFRDNSMVSQTNFIGTPFKHWFFRSQKML